MPYPKNGEDKSEYIDRCIPYVLKEGTAKNEKQAAAICYSMWEKHEISENIVNKIDMLLCKDTSNFHINEELQLKLPKGYRVNIYSIGSGMNVTYDYRITQNGNVVMRTSGTTFNYKEDAKKHGIESAMIIAGLIPDRMNFKKRKELGID